jgi:uncharacterized protein
MLYIQLNIHRTRTYEWDPDKRESTLAARAIDFAKAVDIFDRPTLERIDARHLGAEIRIIAVGVVGGECLTLVYTDRPQRDGSTIRRIISARRSNRRERQAYQNAGLPG